MTILNELQNYILGLDLNNVPQPVINKAKNLIIDTVGVMIAGKEHPISRKVLKTTANVQNNFPQFNVRDIVMNGIIMSTVYDFDDMNDNNYIHSGRIVIPTALMLGIKNKITGKMILEAIIAGYDIHSRIASASKRKECGHRWNVTSICGAYASTAVASKIYQFDDVKIKNALGIAYSFASGNMLSKKQETDAYFIQQGMAGYNGITAAWMANEGLSGPDTILEDEKSDFYSLYFKDIDRAIITAKLGEHFHLSDVSIKAFPSDRSNHAALSAVMMLKQKHHLDIKNIKKISVYVTTTCYNKIGKRITPDQFETQAKYSGSFVIASYLVQGILTPSSFDLTNAKNREIMELVQKIEVIANKELDEKYNNEAISPARIEIQLTDGTTFTETSQPKGGLLNELTPIEIEQKFKQCTEGFLKDQQIQQFYQNIKNLETLQDVSILKEYLPLSTYL